MLSQQAKVDARTHLGDTPLHFAMASKEPTICQILVDFGADIDIWGSSGSARELARLPTQNESIREILDDAW